MKNKDFAAMRRKINFKLIKAAVALKNGSAGIKENVCAMGTIEVVLIVAILVALALLFKGFISEYANKIFSSIENKTDTAFQGW